MMTWSCPFQNDALYTSPISFQWWHLGDKLLVALTILAAMLNHYLEPRGKCCLVKSQMNIKEYFTTKKTLCGRYSIWESGKTIVQPGVTIRQEEIKAAMKSFVIFEKVVRTKKSCTLSSPFSSSTTYLGKLQNEWFVIVLQPLLPCGAVVRSLQSCFPIFFTFSRVSALPFS